MATTHTHDSDAYFVPHSSRWPFLGSIALFIMMVGVANWFNGASWGQGVFFVGIFSVLLVLGAWFGDVISESLQGKYNAQVDTSFRMGMMWFIFSEVMFFAAFFGALGYARMHSVPDLGTIDAKFLWPEYAAVWPTAGPYLKEVFSPMGAWGIPAINTGLLLTSGITLTIAHHAMLENHRSKLILWLAATIILGAIFLSLQVYEYVHAYSELNLKLTTGIFGSTFYMLTGFHGFHVTIGAIMLAVILYRAVRGHFDDKHHFAFEAAAWYWHFVDVVWLGLFVIVYML